MNNRIITAILISICILISSCRDKIEPDPVLPPETPEDTTQTPSPKPQWPEGQQGKGYVWDEDIVPEFHLSFTEKEWNKLLEGYDKNPEITEFVRCAVIFDKGGVRDTLPNTGIRLFDNSDAMRPEGTSGTKHSKENPQWKMSNYELDFTQFVNKEAHTLRKVRSVFLKSCINDPSYARERYCYDLFERFGIGTIGRNIYCRLNIHVEGDDKPVYIGLYQLIEPIDLTFIEDRQRIFGSSEGNLWKCSNGASLTMTSSTIKCGADYGKGITYPYMLLTNKTAMSSATKQLSSFITNVRNLRPDEFNSWIGEVCDVELLLRTYAVNVAVGMWDDYWNRGNNFYLYFNSISIDSYEVFFIPYDYEMSLGNSRKTIMADPGTQDPFKWGNQNNPLIVRLLQCEEYKRIYQEALEELTLPEAYLLEPEISSAIVGDLMYQASFHSSNDVGLNKGTKDRPASWSSNQKYRISTTENNFFSVRSESLKSYLE